MEDIHSGVPFGEVNVHIKLLNGELRWYEFKYSNIYEGRLPVTALISIENVTEAHDRQVSHRRFMQSTQADREHSLSYMEADMTADIIEQHTGLKLWNTTSSVGVPYSDFAHTYTMGLNERENAQAITFMPVKPFLRNTSREIGI